MLMLFFTDAAPPQWVKTISGHHSPTPGAGKPEGVTFLLSRLWCWAELDRFLSGGPPGAEIRAGGPVGPGGGRAATARFGVTGTGRRGVICLWRSSERKRPVSVLIEAVNNFYFFLLTDSYTSYTFSSNLDLAEELQGVWLV